MARKKEFDQNKVLEKAMQTFWHQGYEATSIQNLVETMGINRGSLYDTFQDKHTLFLSAIAHYNETVMTEAIARLEAPDASKQAIIDHFYGLVERTQADPLRRGCLLTNAAVELCAQDSALASRISTSLQRVEDAFCQVLIRARQKGELTQAHDPRALARYLTCSIQGLRVISKVNPDLEALRDIVKLMLSVLE
ncbi:MAG: TetR/AcrR family transcriptional regulator [Cyanothece sp. SIO1E1]|nr:TetR/AcrR family transcriptional regulator [Cyanothece sp. SIO1E1]